MTSKASSHNSHYQFRNANSHDRIKSWEITITVETNDLCCRSDVRRNFCAPQTSNGLAYGASRRRRGAWREHDFMSFYFWQKRANSSFLRRLLCKPTINCVHARIRYRCKQIIIFTSSSRSHEQLMLSLTHINIFTHFSQMATRLQFIRSSWLSRHLCRSSSVLQSQWISAVNCSVYSRKMSTKSGKCLQLDNINPCIKTMEYAVR